MIAARYFVVISRTPRPQVGVVRIEGGEITFGSVDRKYCRALKNPHPVHAMGMFTYRESLQNLNI